MFDQLFGSKTRVSLLKLFLENPDKAYFVREITRMLESQINAVRRELINLEKIGIIQVLVDPPAEDVPAWEDAATKGPNRKKYYMLNNEFVLYNELAALFSKSHVVLEKEMLSKLKELANLYLLIMTGFFTGADQLQTDILIIGNVNKKALSETVAYYEQKLGRDINYTIMSLKEFEYRKEITDKFIYDILVNPKIIVVDKIGENEKALPKI